MERQIKIFAERELQGFDGLDSIPNKNKRFLEILKKAKELNFFLLGEQIDDDIIKNLLFSLASHNVSLALIFLNHFSARKVLELGKIDFDNSTIFSFPLFLDQGLKFYPFSFVTERGLIIDSHQQIKLFTPKRFAPPIDKMGACFLPCFDLSLEDIEYESLGTFHSHFFDPIYSYQQKLIAGLMHGTFEKVLKYCQQREQGGRKIEKWPIVKSRLTILENMIGAIPSRIELLSFHDQAMLLMGGNGYMSEYGMVDKYQDAHLLSYLLLPSAQKLTGTI